MMVWYGLQNNISMRFSMWGMYLTFFPMIILIAVWESRQRLFTLTLGIVLFSVSLFLVGMGIHIGLIP